MKNKNAVYLTQAAMIAAIYVVLTYLANALGLANHAIQVRFSRPSRFFPFLHLPPFQDYLSAVC